MKIIECPRDAMQGIHDFIPTELKTEYINSLLQVGFDTIDFGSFVSPKAIPQMRDTAEVLKALNLSNTETKLLAIIANERGAADACSFEEIKYLGYPFSISETFQQRNTNSSIEESLSRVNQIQELCSKHNKQLVVYISMAFGNPYNDLWSPEIAINWASKLANMGIPIISMADTTGMSTPETISMLFNTIIPSLKNVEIGAHLHSTPDSWKEKIEAAYNAGCIRFDSAMRGFGGCPMASDALTGNIATENLLSFLQEKDIKTGINASHFSKSLELAQKVF
jgi:hydroxymethylglutaryl-CoA lyase